MEILKRNNMWSIHTMGNQLGNNMWNMQSANIFCWFWPSQRMVWFLGISMDCDHQMRIETAISTRCLCPSSSRPVAFSMARIERGLLNEGTRGLGGGWAAFCIGDFSMGDKDRYCMIQGIRLLPTISRGIAILGNKNFQDFMRV